MLTLTMEGEFYDQGKQKSLGVTATLKRGRWQYRDADSHVLIASGMTPAGFAQKFWFRNDFLEGAA